MFETPPNPELLRALGKLIRGLSALFWGLPLALILCVGTAVAGWLRAFSIAPGLVATGLLCYGLWQIGAFQPQERPWRLALDRARLVALVNCGLSPFLFWWYQMPENPFFRTVVGLLAVTGMIFLLNLNLVIRRLGEMLPDETLRQETRQFTQLNRGLLITLVALTGTYLLLLRMPGLPGALLLVLAGLQRFSQTFLLLLVLLPLSMTMALLWKTKEVIMDSVFNQRG